MPAVTVPDRKEGKTIEKVMLDIRSSSGKRVSGGGLLSSKGDTFEYTVVFLRNGKKAIVKNLLEPGAYEVTLTVKGYHPARRSVTIKAGQFAEAMFRLVEK